MDFYNIGPRRLVERWITRQGHFKANGEVARASQLAVLRREVQEACGLVVDPAIVLRGGVNEDDKLEMAVRNGLQSAQIRFLEELDNPAHLDFWLPELHLHIEVKSGHSPRISDQMSRVKNVIVCQGTEAAVFLAQLLSNQSKKADQKQHENVS